MDRSIQQPRAQNSNHELAEHLERLADDGPATVHIIPDLSASVPSAQLDAYLDMMKEALVTARNSSAEIEVVVDTWGGRPSTRISSRDNRQDFLNKMTALLEHSATGYADIGPKVKDQKSLWEASYKQPGHKNHYIYLSDGDFRMRPGSNLLNDLGTMLADENTTIAFLLHDRRGRDNGRTSLEKALELLDHDNLYVSKSLTDRPEKQVMADVIRGLKAARGEAVTAYDAPPAPPASKSQPDDKDLVTEIRQMRENVSDLITRASKELEKLDKLEARVKRHKPDAISRPKTG